MARVAADSGRQGKCRGGVEGKRKMDEVEGRREERRRRRW